MKAVYIEGSTFIQEHLDGIDDRVSSNLTKVIGLNSLLKMQQLVLKFLKESIATYCCHIHIERLISIITRKNAQF